MINVFVTVAFLASALCVARVGPRRIAGLLALTGATWWLGDVVPQAALLHRGPLLQLLLAYPGAGSSDGTSGSRWLPRT